MRSDYTIEGALSKIELSLNSKVVDDLKAMSAHMKLTDSEIVNVALRGFISRHSDFFPPDHKPNYKRH